MPQGPILVSISGRSGSSTAINDGTIPTQKAAVQVLHQADNQQPGVTANALLTGGSAQGVNAVGNLDRQRVVAADLSGTTGIFTGAASFGQELQFNCTTSVVLGALTAVLQLNSVAGLKINSAVNFEPITSLTFPPRYESAVVTAINAALNQVTVGFSGTGALFAHSQPYVLQAFVWNQERDFSGEGPASMGVGAAIATEFESSSGGPPLASGLASGWTIDADRNIQGKNNASLAITATMAGSSTLTFTGNPWTSGLVLGTQLVLSVTANGVAVEEVIVSKNNVPVTGAGPITVNLVNSIVNSGSAFVLFDRFGLGVPSTASPIGTEDTLIWLNDPNATDSKRPLAPLAKALGGANAAEVRSGGITSSLNVTGTGIIKGSPGRVVRVLVIVAVAGGNITFNDCATASVATTSNAIATILSGTAPGSPVYLDFPCLTGIVVSFAGGATGTLAVSYD